MLKKKKNHIQVNRGHVINEPFMNDNVCALNKGAIYGNAFLIADKTMRKLHCHGHGEGHVLLRAALSRACAHYTSMAGKTKCRVPLVSQLYPLSGHFVVIIRAIMVKLNYTLRSQAPFPKLLKLVRAPVLLS